MGAIVGLIGEGSLNEVRALAERMPHRGAEIHVWSPAPGVHFGTVGAPGHALGRKLLAADAQLDESSPAAVAELLEREGAAALRGVSGYFALAFWDETRGQTLLAVDTSGFKSLYYVRLPGRIAFASEYKALLALPDLEAELDRDAAQYYLAARSFRMERPLLEGVHALTAGSLLTVRGTDARPGRYWSPVLCIERASRAAFASEARATLERVTLRQTRRFTRAGITLSGGLDSASVLALLRSVRPDLHLSSYTIGFGEADGELQGGRELADLFHTDHHSVVFDPACIPERLPWLVWLMEDCAGREEALLQHLVLAEAARFEPVVFGGYGADVLFAGMPRYRLLRLRDAAPGLRTPLAELFQYTQTGVPPATLLGKLGRGLLHGGGGYPPPAVIGARGPARVADDVPLERFIASQLCEAQDSGYIEPSLEAAGVEFRDPFQSTEMLDLALRMPGRYNVGLRSQKMILRAALADLLPPRVARRTKSLQLVRHDADLCDVLDGMADGLLAPQQVRERGIVPAEYVAALRRRRRGEAYSSERLYRLWTLVCLELWQRHFIDHRGRSDALDDVPDRRALPAA